MNMLNPFVEEESISISVKYLRTSLERHLAWYAVFVSFV
jgi:hypothetical protein